MKLNKASLGDEGWKKAGFKLPEFDIDKMSQATAENPVWVHFGSGNIFRAFIAVLAQRLLEGGYADTGIIAAETFDYDIIDKIYTPFDNLTIAVGLKPDGSIDKEIVASVPKAVKVNVDETADYDYLKKVFRSPSLQMISFTITEKGYALTDLNGNYLPVVVSDIENGPANSHHAMSLVAALLLERFNAGAMPIAVVSMDNCSHNGEKLKSSVTKIAEEWLKKGHVSQEFVDWIEDETKVSFPWTMIDKITPRPAAAVEKELEDEGVEDMAPIVTSKGTYIAPFVNAEIPQYLIVEDRFPNGRPALEKAGVYMTDRDTVNKTERMKVSTCLNPLHTSMSVYGCLLGYTSIASEMDDPDIKKLIETVGYVEGMPVVTDPGIIRPEAFIHEVIDDRFPNPFMPDTPQRICTDTSQKLPVRFGETIKSYVASPDLDVTDLTAIPLAIAGWLRYLLGVDDEGNEFKCSDDPMLDELQKQLAGIKLGDPDSVDDKLIPILSNDVLFASDLVEIGLADKIEGMFKELIAGPGAVRETLHKYMSEE